MPRRLAAILAADVVGFTQMMSTDEAGTLELLLAFRKAGLDPLTRQHGGRIVKVTGDAALVQFSSVVSAVECALGLQAAARGFRDGALALRIGVHLGDVIFEAGDVYGDGVNTAARLESIAAPGGLSVSGVVYDSLGNRVSAQFTDRGDVALKGLAQPVRVFDWAPEAVVQEIGKTTHSRKSDRPSLAVLAFDNMSGDAGQEYFSDGIAEDIITALSQFRQFFVIARNTSFSFKGQSVRVDQICDELGVRYLLEGSVRKAGNRVRVTAQLIDGESGAHIWAEKYDRDLNDIFDVQDEITRAIVAAVAPQTLDAELARARSKPAGDLSAWDKVLQARWHISKLSRDSTWEARRLLDEAISAAPDLAGAHSAMAMCELYIMLHFWDPDPIAAQSRARTAAERAVELDERDADAHAVLGMALTFARDFDGADTHLKRATALNPNFAAAYGIGAALYGVSNELERAEEAVALALELSPRDPVKFFWYGGFGAALYLSGQYERCLDMARQVLREHPGYASSLRQEAAALGMLGRTEEAGAAVARMLERMPGLTVETVRHIVPIRHPDDHEHWLEGLRRAGLPER